MAKAKNPSNKDAQIVELKQAVAALKIDLGNARDDLKKSRAEESRQRTKAAAAKTKADKAIASAKTGVQDALAGLGPSVLAVLAKESTTGDNTVLQPGTVIGVIHPHGKINTDYLISAIHTGRARITPGITEGVFEMADLVELRDRNAELEATLEKLTAPEDDKKKDGGKKGGGQS